MKAIRVVVMTQSAIIFFTGIPVKLALWYRIGGHAVYNIPFYTKYPTQTY